MRHLPPWAGLALVALTLLAYARFLGTGFAATDTLPLIETSRLNGPGDALVLFQQPVMAGTRFVRGEIVYRPFVSLTFGLDYLAWGLNPLGYHVTNVLLHLAGVVGVWCMLARLGLRWWSSLAGAALFALHPLVVASVPVIARRDSVLPVVAFVWAAALLLIAQQTPRAPAGLRWLALVGSYTLGALALLSKESAFVALAILPAIVLSGALANCLGFRQIVSRAALLIPLLGIGAAVFAVRWAVLGGLGGAPDNKGLLVVDFDQYSQVLGAFTRDLLWPFAWIAPSTRTIWPRLALGITLGVAVTLPWLPRRQALLGAAGGLWIVGFGAFGVLFKIQTIAWLAYFVLVGVSLLVAAALEGGLVQLRRRHIDVARHFILSRAAALVLLVGVGIFSLATLRESALARDYYQWDIAGQVTRRYTDAVAECVTSSPEATGVRLRGLPGSFDDGQVATSLLGVTLLEDYTVDAALALELPDRRINVDAESFTTLRAGADTLHLTCEHTGNLAVLTTTS